MKRFARTISMLFLMHTAWLSAQTPPAETAPQTTPKPGDPVIINANPAQRPLATAPANTPIVRTHIPELAENTGNYEHWKLDLTIGYWPLRPTGKIKTQTTPGDLKNDFGVAGYKSHPYIRVLFKPYSRHTFLLEGIFYRLNGAATLNRELVFAGRTFTARDQVEDRIKMNSFNLNYRYNFVARNTGFVAAVFGLGYLRANARITDLTQNVGESNRAKAVFPMLGIAFRSYPAHSFRFSLDGEVKGMHFGNYGYYAQTNFGAGLSLNRHIMLHLGYSELDADVHDKKETQGLVSYFRGPTISLQLRH